jgi:RNA polymerase sigma factor (TIGR02999 family)
MIGAPGRRSSVQQDSGRITQLLVQWRAGDPGAESALIEAVYPVLRQLARQRLNRAAPMTLAVTDLVHDAYIKLIDQRDTPFANRSHFYAISAHVIRRLLVDHQRERMAQKRGGDDVKVTLDAALDVPSIECTVDVLDIDRLLTRLERIKERAAKLVELRFFAGLSLEEAAENLSVSLATAKRDWQFARAWLNDQLQLSAPPLT